MTARRGDRGDPAPAGGSGRGACLHRLLSCAAAILIAAAPARAAEGCFEALAATHDGSYGAPLHPEPMPDGRSVLFLRSGPRDTRLRLFRYDVATAATTELARPAEAPEQLSVQEKARRERARMALSGITDYAVSRDGGTLLVSEADRLTRISLPAGDSAPVPGSGWIAPRLSPDGRFVAAVHGDDLHVVELAGGHDLALTSGGSDSLSRGLAEFAAAEELDRADGTWWSPDSSTLLYEEADSSAVERHFIADPEHPASAPVEFRYPRAGTANAHLRLGLIGRGGGATRWVDWDSTAFPYLVRVVWPQHGRLSLVVLNRAQTEQRVLAVDPATGHASTLLSERDPAWINISPGLNWRAGALPRWLPDGSGFLWAAEIDDRWRLELRHADGSLDHALTGADLPFLSLEDLDARAGTVTVLADPDRLDAALFRISLRTSGATPLATEPGLHDARFAEDGHAIFTDAYEAADGSTATRVRDASGRVLGTLPSVAEPLPIASHVAFTAAGARRLDAVVIRPDGFVPGRRYPVILSVYAGPGVKMVQRAPRHYLEEQCLADHGFVVVALDGRGTPGRGHDWERATKGDLIDLPLRDQADGLRGLARRYPEMDLGRAGVTGWSFGGYFTAMATIRRPELFRAGVAGAPVVDFADYDTAYTERYLGLPSQDPEGYRVSNVLTYAASLSRPLLLLHGLTDDNVYFENTVKLTQALVAAGRPYRLLLLPGTHMLSDPKLRARVAEARVAFLAEQLRAPAPTR